MILSLSVSEDVDASVHVLEMNTTQGFYFMRVAFDPLCCFDKYSVGVSGRQQLHLRVARGEIVVDQPESDRPNRSVAAAKDGQHITQTRK